VISRALAVVVVLAAPIGCASPCARVSAAHAEITTRTEPSAPGDHLRLSIPRELLDLVIARELRKVPRARLPLPAIAGMQLGTASVGVDRVHVVPAARSEVGFDIDVSVRSGSRVLLPLRLKASVRPRLEPTEARLVLALDEQGLVRLDAELGPGGNRALVEALWAELPAPARMLTSKKQLAELAGSLGKRLLADATKLVRRELLDDLARVARVEIDLPPIDADAIDVRSTETDLVVGVHTSLPVRGAIPEAQPRSAPPHQVELTMHGSAAVELVNAAMRRGEVPSRFALDGVADPKGALQAHLDWAVDEPKPLVVHAFLLDPRAAGRPEKDCAHVTLGATPRVTANAGNLSVATDDAKIDSVTGSTAVKAGLLFGGVTRRSFEHVEHVAADTEFELGAQTLRAQVQSATLRGQHLVLGLTLAPAR
jgi:hypothetical protein